mmetsp:Transcript_60345/g.130820  ORF Transcript_60345/g.130820 Transcript_60345/m.130820 type:complete len:165 (+) Transcript_60345:1306-1800(+)
MRVLLPTSDTAKEPTVCAKKVVGRSTAGRVIGLSFEGGISVMTATVSTNSVEGLVADPWSFAVLEIDGRQSDAGPGTVTVNLIAAVETKIGPDHENTGGLGLVKSVAAAAAAGGLKSPSRPLRTALQRCSTRPTTTVQGDPQREKAGRLKAPVLAPGKPAVRAL